MARTAESNTEAQNGAISETAWDVVVVGGGSAGLSAALTLARARRSVLVIDSGQPRNAPADAAHGLLGLEGINPLALLERGRSEARTYGARIVDGRVVEASGTAADGFTLRLGDGSALRASHVLITTGTRDDLPPIDGMASRWGRDVVHCPYCHGWEIQNQRIGVVAAGPMSAMQALLFRQWSESMVFFPNGLDYPADQLAKVAAVGIDVVPGIVGAVQVGDVSKAHSGDDRDDGDRLTGVLMDDGTSIPLDAVALPTLTHPRLDGLEGLGIDVAESPMGSAVVADAMGHTSIPGVWAAGNVVNAGMQVSESAANGARVAMTINTEMAFAFAESAVAATTAAPNQ